MMKKNARDILFYELKFFARTQAKGFAGHALPMNRSLKDLFEDVKQYIQSSGAPKLYVRQHVAYYVADIQVTDECVVIVFNSVDKQSTNPVAVDSKNINSPKSKEELIIKPGWGLSNSSHVVIQLNTVGDNGYMMCKVEKTDGAPFSKTNSILDEILKKTCYWDHVKEKYKIPHPQGDGASINYFVSTTRLAHGSDDFRAQLEKNELTGISLVGKPAAVRGHDPQQHIPFQSAALKIDHKLAAVPGQRRGWLKRLFATAKATEMAEVKIQFIDDDNHTRTANIDSATGHLLNESRLIKTVTVQNVKGADSSAVDSVNYDLVEKMIAI